MIAAPDCDVAARGLRRWARTARRMPRGAWEFGGQSHPVVAPNGARVARAMPGVGLALDFDLEAIGIRRPIPGVVGRSRFMRWAERMMGERGAITSIADVQAAYATKQITVHPETWAPSGGADTWQEQIDLVSASAFGTSGGSAMNRNTAGAYNAAMRDPPAGKRKLLVGLGLASMGATGNIAMGILIDALSSVKPIACTSTSVQSFTTPALTRYTNGIGVYGSFWWPSGSGASLAAGTTCTVVYTNQDGTGSRSSTWTTNGGTTPEAVEDLSTDGFGHPHFYMQAGDYGVQSVQSFQLSAADVASNGAACLLWHPLVFVLPQGDQSVSLYRDVVGEPQILTEITTEAGGTLGYVTFLFMPDATGGTPTTVFTLETIDG